MATVLVVDDDPAAVGFAESNLEAVGHTVRTAGDGEAALAAVRVEPPDVLVLDVLMPLLDGWGALERLKADPDERIRTTPVVMLTALDAETDRLRAGIEGAVGYLTKPVMPEDLVAEVARVLAGGPEPAQRKAVLHLSLARLAGLESGRPSTPAGPRVRLSRLERARSPQPHGRPAAVTTAVPLPGELTEKQRRLLGTLAAASSVSEAAATLGMSRSNVYASLRRIGRKLGVPDVSALLGLLRQGALADSLEP